MLPRGVRLIFYLLSSLFLILLLLQSNLNQTPPQDSVSLHVAKSSIYSLSAEQRRGLILKREENRNMTSSVAKSVHRFLFFMEHSQSGHSVVAMLLDAHPHIVISHEYSVFLNWMKKPKRHADKTWLFNRLLLNSWKHTIDIHRTKKQFHTLSAISGGWQGRFKKYVQVIGDMATKSTTQFYGRNQSLFIKTYKEMKKSLNIPINAIHVVRNPYDSISSMLLHTANTKLNLSILNKYHNSTGLEEHIWKHFKQLRTIVKMVKNVPLTIIRVHIEDLISSPKYVMRTMCSFLHVECSSTYLQFCANSMYSSESHSRDLVHWTKNNIELVSKNIKDFHFLRKYAFTSV